MGDSRALNSFDNCGSTFYSPQSMRAADMICDSPANSSLSQKHSAMKAKKGSDLSEPFSVPGTGTDDVANNRTLRNWWILRQMPL